MDYNLSKKEGTLNRIGVSWNSNLTNVLRLPPLPNPKSYHTFLLTSTLNDAVCSSRNGDRYHQLFPLIDVGWHPYSCRKSVIFSLSDMFIVFVCWVVEMLRNDWWKEKVLSSCWILCWKINARNTVPLLFFSSFQQINRYYTFSVSKNSFVTV